MKRKIAAMTGLCAMLAVGAAYAEDNVVSWDATTDPRVEATKIERCVGSTIECAAQGANWSETAHVDMPATSWTDAGVFEGRTYNYRGYFWNSDQGVGPPSEVASKDVPFSAPPSEAPAGFTVN